MFQGCDASFSLDKKSLHVLVIAQYFYPDIGGASTRAYNSALALKKQGCEVTVVTSFPHYPHGNIPPEYGKKIVAKEVISDIKVIRTWIPSLPHSSVRNRVILNLSFILSSLMAIGRIKRPNIIIAMNPNLFSFFSAIVYRIVYRRRIIRNVDDLWPEVFYDLGIVKSRVARKFLDIAAKLSYHHSSSLIPVSEGYVKTLVEKYDVPLEKITVIEHGVDLNKFRRKMTDDSPKIGKKIIMYSGALAVGYDFKSIVQAAKMLEAEPIHFIIRGNGPMYADILRLVEEYQVSNVEVSNTLLPIQDLVSLLNTADIFILPMNSTGVIDEGLPTKILEYQALGKPIICISEGEPGRYILRCQCGLVVRPSQPLELAENIVKLAGDDTLCKELGENGYSYITNNLTFEKIGKRLLDVIEKS